MYGLSICLIQMEATHKLTFVSWNLNRAIIPNQGVNALINHELKGLFNRKASNEFIKSRQFYTL